MPRTRRAYPPEFRQQIVELHRAGRRPGELAREFEPNEQTIRNWIAQADLDEGRRRDGPVERAELRKLRKENLRVELGKSRGLVRTGGIRFQEVFRRESESDWVSPPVATAWAIAETRDEANARLLETIKSTSKVVGPMDDGGTSRGRSPGGQKPGGPTDESRRH